MASSTLLDSKGLIGPEDRSAYTTPPHNVLDLGPEKPQFSPKQLNSPQGDHCPPINTRADSHQHQVHSHSNEFHTDDQLTGGRYGSKVNSASQVKLWLQPNRSSTLSEASEVNTTTHRFSPYYNSPKLPQSQTHTVPKPTELDCFAEKHSKSRKRTVILKPKCPKYQGLSNFAAPVDLVSDMVPSSKAKNLHQSSSPSLKSVSDLAPEKMGWESSTDSTTTDSHPPEANAQTPIDFLKYLEFEEWDRRKQDLSQMVEDRKKLFLQNGFAETSGKAFQPDEQAIDKKPIPNRWVWYMHLSTDYDKLKNTRVPPGGPAGYLKYGWDRLGPAGKQPYQELADIYSAQRLKFMAEHGITEDNTKKKPKQSEKLKPRRDSSQEVMIRADNNPREIGFINETVSPSGKITSISTESMGREIRNERPNFHLEMPFMPIQPILQYNLLYQQSNPFVHEKLNWNYANGPEVFEISEPSSCPSYLRSPEMSTDYFSPFGNDVYGPQSLGLPSSPTEHSFGCNPSSMFPYQTPSDYQARYALSPDSIHSASDVSGVLPSSCFDNGLVMTPGFGGLPHSNSFYEPFDLPGIDFPALNQGNINS